jgi:hypothetical protein
MRRGNMNTRLTRTRWAAIGAAVAVSLGAGGFGLAGAVSSGERPVTITVEPERILDTRINLGLPGPFVPNTPRDVQVTGSVPVASGPAKIVVPTDAVAVVVNVTVVNPSRSGFLSLRPGGAAGTPLTSTVNFTTGSDEPNAATVDLGPGGTVQVYVHAATAHVVLDVVGYTVDHDHDDRYLQSKEVSARLLALETAQPFVVTARNSFEEVVAVDEVVVSVTVIAPVAGQVTVFSTSALGDTDAGEETRCTITLGTERETGFLQRWESGGPNSGQHAQLSGVRTFDIEAGATVPYNLVCDHFGPGSTNMESTTMSAIFTPAP